MGLKEITPEEKGRVLHELRKFARHASFVYHTDKKAMMEEGGMSEKKAELIRNRWVGHHKRMFSMSEKDIKAARENPKLYDSFLRKTYTGETSGSDVTSRVRIKGRRGRKKL
jgi:hypothetical protein